MYFVLNWNVLPLLSFYALPFSGNRKKRWSISFFSHGSTHLRIQQVLFKIYVLFSTVERSGHLTWGCGFNRKSCCCYCSCCSSCCCQVEVFLKRRGQRVERRETLIVHLLSFHEILWRNDYEFVHLMIIKRICKTINFILMATWSNNLGEYKPQQC